MEAAPRRLGRNRAEWYACYTRGRHEKRVARLLGDRGFRVFLPLVSRLRRWHDREKVVEFPLFPSYVFVRCGPADLVRALSTPGLVEVVRFDGKPVAIPEVQIESVRVLARGLPPDGPEPEVGPMVSTGQRVRVTEGPLAGVQGVVAERRGRGRVVVVVGVSAIEQGLRIAVDSDSVRVVDD